jgi:hypothetical protein
VSKVVIIADERGFTVAEESNYTYLNEATARAFARDKWGDENPVIVEPVQGYQEHQTPMSVSPAWKPDGTGFRDGWSNK